MRKQLKCSLNFACIKYYQKTRSLNPFDKKKLGNKPKPKIEKFDTIYSGNQGVPTFIANKSQFGLVQFIIKSSSGIQSSCCIFIVEAVEVLHCAAVHVEPPVTGEVLLVVEGPNGAQPGEAGLVYTTCAVVVDLAFSFRVSVETRRQTIASEGSSWDLGEVRIVPAWSSWDGTLLFLLEGGHNQNC